MSELTGGIRLTGTSAEARRLGRLVDAAAACVARNVVASGGRHILRAGGGYPEPWTRDAAINTWQAAAWLCPEVAAETLRAVCDPEHGSVADDDQWWDQIVWVIGARQLAMVTGDADWARFAHDIGVATLARLDERCLGADGLYRGPAVMADGITGYPPSLHDPARSDASFVLDHPAARDLRCLSTNATYVWALRCLAELAAVVGVDPAPWSARADELAARVRDAFWIPDEGRFGYLLADGVLDRHQEGLGLALAILSDTATPAQAGASVAGVVRAPRGLPAVSPHFAGYHDDRPGRHGGALWPMIMGVWAQAVARTGDRDAFGAELGLLADLLDPDGQPASAGSADSRSGPAFWEVYHPVTGKPDGGWQTGRHWRSEPDQTWSATTLIGTVLYGLAGLQPAWEGLRWRPCVPPGLGDLELGFDWRGHRVALVLSETGPSQATVDGIGDGSELRPAVPAVPAVPAPRPGGPSATVPSRPAGRSRTVNPGGGHA